VKVGHRQALTAQNAQSFDWAFCISEPQVFRKRHS
jgi:hypothetical protein